MASMQAYQIVEWGKPPEYREVSVPEPGAGQLLVKMAGAGLCRTDLNIIKSPSGFWPDPPFTIGHENAGWVTKVGSSVEGFAEGDGVLVSSMYYCGYCEKCARGMHEQCRNIGLPGYGVGYDGGLAEYILIEAKHAIQLGTLSPVTAAPLADAAATSYHAVKLMLDFLVPGSTAVVIGVGGLGAYAVQYLRLLSGTRIIGVDTARGRLEDAARLGAHETVLSDENAAENILELAPAGVDGVFDFVGRTETMGTGVKILSQGARLVVAGIGGGEIPMGWEKIAMNAGFINTRGFNVPDLNEIVALARDGRIEMAATHFPFDKIEDGLQALEGASVKGRAVVTFD
ncbi:alcohol dehydrogenase catalytic domain-containing protein [Georgenia sp. SYP-B2076]|uniref:alcohol dehydrogenase catalytic domain-containing protein n=1 Tax=Georgenia sp. SYP-B2076 TaxID=2495881 RepID=UPI0013DF9B46|nr:alcohol dehydrogenase catalytic domain-containing protein [Georgenia sp. SYP-B2076]